MASGIEATSVRTITRSPLGSTSVTLRSAIPQTRRIWPGLSPRTLGSAALNVNVAPLRLTRRSERMVSARSSRTVLSLQVTSKVAPRAVSTVSR